MDGIAQVELGCQVFKSRRSQSIQFAKEDIKTTSSVPAETVSYDNTKTVY